MRKLTKSELAAKGEGRPAALEGVSKGDAARKICVQKMMSAKAGR